METASLSSGHPFPLSRPQTLAPSSVKRSSRAVGLLSSSPPPCAADSRPLPSPEYGFSSFFCRMAIRMRSHTVCRSSGSSSNNSGSGSRSGDFLPPPDEFGPYPWDPSWQQPLDDSAIQWIQEDLVTLFTSDGLVQLGGSLIPHQMSLSEKREFRGKVPMRYRRFREEDYMDSKQGLCLGALFDIVATNKLDTGRRFCVFGFCRSIEMLSDVVEDTVLEQGGEIVLAEKASNGGLNEKLSMMVAMPLLWGVPPAVDSLNYAIRCGGGIVEKVAWQWEFL